MSNGIYPRKKYMQRQVVIVSTKIAFFSALYIYELFVTHNKDW